jgi:very-short-patch-repair endonuclease
VRKLTVQAVVKNANALVCKVCLWGDRPSSHEARAYAEIDKMGMGSMVTECKVLMEKYGAADIFLPAWNLLLQFDGEQHYRGKPGTEECAHQVARDRRFVAAAAAKGFNLIRVAHQEVAELQQLVGLMLARMDQCPGPHTLLSYHSMMVMGFPTDAEGFVAR